MTQLGPESLNTHTISQRESIGWLHVHVCQCVHVCACVYVCVHVCAHLCVCVCMRVGTPLSTLFLVY